MSQQAIVYFVQVSPYEGIPRLQLTAGSAGEVKLHLQSQQCRGTGAEWERATVGRK